MKVILLAAGYATRLYPLTQTVPKALLPISGRKMLDFILDGILELEGVSEICLVTNAKFAGQFEAYAKELQTSGYPYVLHVFNDGTLSEDDRLGALGDLDLVLESVGRAEETLVLASDNLFTYSLACAQKRFEACGGDLILGQKIEDLDTLKRFGVARVDAQGRVIEMEEKSPNPISHWGVYATYFYRPIALQRLKEYLDSGEDPDAPGSFPAWLCQKETVYFHAFEGICIDIGTPESYALVRDSWPQIQVIDHETLLG